MTKRAEQMASPRWRREIEREAALRDQPRRSLEGWQAPENRDRRYAERSKLMDDTRWVGRAQSQDIRNYEGALSKLARQRAVLNDLGHESGHYGYGDDVASMTHMPEAPRRPVTMDIAGRPVEIGRADYRAAGPLTTFANGARLAASAPLYALPATRLPMAALDAIEGGLAADPLQVAFSGLGGAKPLALAGAALYGITPSQAEGFRSSGRNYSAEENAAVYDYADNLGRERDYTTGGGFAEGGEVDDEGIDEAAELGRIYSAIQRYGLGRDGPEYVLYPEPEWPAGMPTVNRSFGGSENESDPGGDGRGQTGQEGQNDATGPGTGTEGGDGGGSSGSEGASGVGGDVGGGTEGNAEGNAEGEQGADAAAAPADGPTGLGAVAADAAVAAQAPAADPESAVANNMNTPDQTSEIGFQGPSLGQMLGINEAQAAVAPDHLGLKSATDRATDYADLDPLGTIQGLVEGLSAPAPGFNTATSPLGSNLGLGLGDQATEAAQALGYGVAPGPATEAPAPGPSEDFDGTFGLADLSAPTPGPVGVATAATIGAPTAPTAPTDQPVGHPSPPSRDPTLGLTAPNFTTHDPTEVGRFGIPGLTPGFAPTNLDTLAETRQQAALEAEQEQAQIEAMMEAQQIRDMELAQLFDPTLMGPPQNFQAPEPVDPVTDPYGRMATNLETRSPAQQTQDMAVSPAPAPPMGPDEFSLNLPEVPEVHTVELPEAVPQTVREMIEAAIATVTNRAPEMAAHRQAMQQPNPPSVFDRQEQRAARERSTIANNMIADAQISALGLAAPPSKEQAQLGTAPAAVAAAQQADIAPAVEAPPAPAPEVVEAPAPEVAPAPSAPNRAATAAVQSVQPSATTTRSTTQAEEEETTSPLTFSVQPRAPAPETHPEPPARPTDMVPIGVPSDRRGPMVTEVKGHPAITGPMRSLMTGVARGAISGLTGAPFGLIDSLADRLGLPSIGGLIGKSQPAQTNAPYGNDEGQGSYGGPLGSFVASLPSGVAGPTPGQPGGEYGDPMEYDPRDFLGYPENPETYGQRTEHRYYAGGGLVRRAKRLIQDRIHPAELERLGQLPLDLGDLTGHDRIQADRMRRAESLGYTQPAFHGTNHPIERFRKGFTPLSHFGTSQAASDRISAKRGFDAEKYVPEWEMQEYAELLGLPGAERGYGRWTAEQGENIKQRLLVEQPWIGRRSPTGEPTEHILPLVLNRGKSLEVRDNGLGDPWQHAKVVEESLDELGDGRRLWGGKTGWDKLAFQTKGADQMLSRRLNELGIDSLHYRNNGEDIGSESYVITRPNQVRSIYARFDPDKVKSSDIMASVAPVGAAGVAGAAAMGDEREYSGGGLVRAARMARREAQAVDNADDLMKLPPLARADMLGFDTPAYHGTFHPLEAFSEGFRPLAHFGTADAATQRLNDLREVKDPWRLSNYDLKGWADEMGLTESDLPSYRWSREETERIKNRLMVEQPWLGKYRDRHSGPDRSKSAEHILPLRLRLGNSLEVPDNGLTSVIDHAGAANRGLLRQGLEPLWKDYDDPSYTSFKNPETLRQALEDRGFDSLRYVNNHEDAGSMSYVTLRPNQVRSIYAKFDPRKLDSGDIMAGVAPVGAAGAIAANQGETDMGPLERYARGGQVKGYALGGLTGVNDIRPLAMTGGLGGGEVENLSYAPSTPMRSNPIPAPVSGMPGTSFNPAQPTPPTERQAPLSYGGMGGVLGFGGNGAAGVWTPWGVKTNAFGSGWGAGMGGGLVGGQASTRTYTPPVNPETYGQRPQQQMWG